MGIADQRNIENIKSSVAKITASLWGIEKNILIKNGENITFKGTHGTNTIYTRITESSRRSRNQILAEIEWVDFLSRNNIPVANPIKNRNEEFIHSFSVDGEELYLAVFNNANGVDPSKSSFSSSHIASCLGQTMANIHRQSITKRKTLSSPRHSWIENIHVVEAEEILNEFCIDLKEEWITCLNWWKALTQKNVLSLVHMDAHIGNFHIDELGKICLFDFDDCAMNFLSYDLAVAILGLQRLADDDSEKNKIEKTFIKSYLSKYDLEQIWIDRIEPFKRLRDIEMLAWSLRMYGIENNKKQKTIDDFRKKLEVAAQLI